MVMNVVMVMLAMMTVVMMAMMTIMHGSSADPCNLVVLLAALSCAAVCRGNLAWPWQGRPFALD